MAGNIKGITIEFAGDTTQLDKSLRDVNKHTRDIDKELRQVDKGLKFNPTNVDLWRQKQTLLTQKIGETEKKLTVLKQKQAQMDAAKVDKNSAAYRDLQREIITTESKLKTFKGQLQAVGNVKLRALSASLKEMGGKLTAAGQATAGLSRAGAALAAGIGALAYKAGTYADDLNTLSKQYRINTKDLQKYKAAADLVDVSVEDIAKSHVKLTKNMASAQKGSKTQAAAFKALGVNVTDSNGKLRDTDTVWQEVIAKLGKMKNATERDALAMDLMGKSASQLNPLIEDGGETYKNVSDTLKKYKLDFIDQKTLDDANKFNDSLDTIKAVGGVAFQNLGMKLAQLFAPALEKVVGWVGKFAEWLGKLNPVVVAITGVLGGVLAVVSPLLLLAGGLVSAMGALTGALAGISAPILAVVGVIAGLIAIFATAYAKSASFRSAVGSLASMLISTFKPVVMSVISGFKTLISEVIKTVTVIADSLAPVIKKLMPVFKAIAKLLAGALKYAFNLVIGVIRVFLAIVRTVASVFKSAFSAVVSIASNVVGKIKTIFGKVKDALTHPFETAKKAIKGIVDAIKGFFGFKVSPPKIPLPHFAVKPKGWGIGDLVKGKIPSLSVKWYAKGGIFNQPTLAGIGEAGPEAVVPLDKLWKKLDEMQGGNTINVYPAAGMNEQELAELVMQKMIQLQNRRRLAWQ